MKCSLKTLWGKGIPKAGSTNSAVPGLPAKRNDQSKELSGEWDPGGQNRQNCHQANVSCVSHRPVLHQPWCTQAAWKCYSHRHSEVLQEKVEGNLDIYENSQDCSVLKFGLKYFLNLSQGQQYTCVSQMQT